MIQINGVKYTIAYCGSVCVHNWPWLYVCALAYVACLLQKLDKWSGSSVQVAMLYNEWKLPLTCTALNSQATSFENTIIIVWMIITIIIK